MSALAQPPVAALPPVLAELGPPERIFRYSRFWFIVTLALGGCSLFFGLAVIGIFVYFQINPPRQPIPGGAVYWFGIGGSFLGLGVLVGILAFFKNRQRLLIYPTALVRLSGSSIVNWPWSEISEVYQHYLNPAVLLADKLWVTGPAGKKLVIEGFDSQRVLAAQIQEHVTEQRLPASVQRIEAGETVAFGKLGISKRGLVYKGTECKWDELHLISYEYNRKANGMGMIISKNSGLFSFCSIYTHQVPNLILFLKLVEKYCPRLTRAS